MAVYFEVADTTLILKSLQIIARNACLAESGEAWVKKKQQREIYTEEKKTKKGKEQKKPRLVYHRRLVYQPRLAYNRIDRMTVCH